MERSVWKKHQNRDPQNLICSEKVSNRREIIGWKTGSVSERVEKVSAKSRRNKSRLLLAQLRDMWKPYDTAIDIRRSMARTNNSRFIIEQTRDTFLCRSYESETIVPRNHCLLSSHCSLKHCRVQKPFNRHFWKTFGHRRLSFKENSQLRRYQYLQTKKWSHW